MSVMDGKRKVPATMKTPSAIPTAVPATTKDSVKAELSRYFGIHGRFCASHPWEVIVTTVTLTVCVLSMSVLSGGKVGTVCGINKPCQRKTPEEEKADTFLLIIVNSLAVLYLYNQFSNLRKAGSKYLLGISAVFTLFASFIFGSGVVNLLDYKASGLHEALPFFLLLMDLSKATYLAQYAAKSRTREEVRENIGKGMAILGPTLSLDTVVEILIIGIGTISGMRQLEMVCCFGCISLVANYIVFMTFFPAALALFLEVCPDNPDNMTWHIDELARGLQEVERKPNPVVQRVKVIMSLGLVVVHLHSRFLSQVTGMTFGFTSSSISSPAIISKPLPDQETDHVSLQQYIWWKLFNFSLDQIVTITLASVLILKYIFLDKNVPSPRESTPAPTSPSTSLPQTPLVPFTADLTSYYFERRKSLTCPPDIASSTANSHCYSNSITKTKERGGLETSNRDTDRMSSPLLATKRSVAVQTDPTAVAKFIFDRDSISDDELEDEGEGSRRVSEVRTPRPVEECLRIFKSEEPSQLTDDEIMLLVNAKHIPAYKLEALLGDHQRGISIRRRLVSNELTDPSVLDTLPFSNYDFSLVSGACCENVIGYMPIPVGVVGPLLLDGVPYRVPMATTEGTLVASTNRGCRALVTSGGVSSYVVGDGMTRAPVVRFPSAARSSAAKLWLDDSSNFPHIEAEFNSTSNYARLVSVFSAVAGRLLYIRFKAKTGDAMGMNMISKGTEKTLDYLQKQFPDLDVLSVSGNLCTDKKPSAMNWIEGRGKSVVCEATIPVQVVEKVLKTSVDALVDLNISKNLVGSAMAGSIGGYNAHAANIVAAVYIATGQDPAQTVGSSNCITLIERGGATGKDLYISCTMPSLEVGTVGGGTVLAPQAACLKMLGVHGSSKVSPGNHATQLARVVCGTVLAGELSLLSALAAGHLVRSHMRYNRSNLSLPAISEGPITATITTARNTGGERTDSSN